MIRWRWYGVLAWSPDQCENDLLCDLLQNPIYREIVATGVGSVIVKRCRGNARK